MKKSLILDILMSEMKKTSENLKFFLVEADNVIKEGLWSMEINGIKIEDEELSDLVYKDPLFKKLVKDFGESHRLYFNKQPDEKKSLVNKYNSDLFYIIMASTSLSHYIDLFTLACSHIVKADALTSYLANPKPWQRSTIKQLQLLRFADIIPETDYKDLYKLYNIRNEYAHTQLIHMNTKKILDSLNSLNVSDEKIRNLPNDGYKYAEIALYYSHRLWEYVKQYASRKGYDAKNADDIL